MCSVVSLLGGVRGRCALWWPGVVGMCILDDSSSLKSVAISQASVSSLRSIASPEVGKYGVDLRKLFSEGCPRFLLKREFAKTCRLTGLVHASRGQRPTRPTAFGRLSVCPCLRTGDLHRAVRRLPAVWPLHAAGRGADHRHRQDTRLVAGR